MSKWRPQGPRRKADGSIDRDYNAPGRHKDYGAGARREDERQQREREQYHRAWEQSKREEHPDPAPAAAGWPFSRNSLRGPGGTPMPTYPRRSPAPAVARAQAELDLLALGTTARTPPADVRLDLDLVLLADRIAQASTRPQRPPPWYARSRKPVGMSTPLRDWHVATSLADAADFYARELRCDERTAYILAARRPC